MRQVLTLEESFGKIEDPRVERTKQHKLIDILIIAICAIICGAEGWGEIEQFGREKREWLETFLELPNGIPSHDTFNRVFARINPEEFERCFFEWVCSITETIKGVVAIDGKTVRRSHNKRAGKKAIHMVSAWAAENRLVLAQLATEEKSNEITAIPKLLRMLDLSGCIVTIDAIGTQKLIAKQIIEQHGDYALALKKNHGLLYQKVANLFATARQENFEQVPHQQIQVTDKGYGRLEDRRYWIIEDQDIIHSVDKHGDWEGFRSIGMVEYHRHMRQKVTTEVRYYILSIQGNAAKFAHAVRSHWGIENSLHWILDVAFHEDLSRARSGHSAHNLALLRHIALNVLRQERSVNIGIHGKRLKAGWSTNYLERLLLNIETPHVESCKI
jgi:predicted transposase YbfD/YdcC